MTEENNITPEQEKAGNVDVKENAKGLLASISQFLSDLLDIRQDTDKAQTIEGIKADIPFKGHIAWILVFAVFIASIGLNVSSTAVVIGAMLISPLMGPILGIGLSLAIYDIETLKRSFVNLGVMVGLSVITAWLYFELSPLTELTPELEARTSPTILDVLVAIFGGLALIVAKSKKGTMASVIFGVAIATALMPPLCTVGYGLAVWEPKFFLGALYLFSINAVFIALATFFVAKILRFPLVKYANAKKRNRIKYIVMGIAVLAMIPASYTFYNVLKITNFEREARAFIKNEVEANPELFLVDKDYSYETQTIHLHFYSPITKATEADLIKELSDERYSHLAGVQLKIKKGDTDNYELVKDLLNEKRDEVKNQRKTINELENRVLDLETELEQSVGRKPIDFLSISKDAKIQFNDLKTITFSKALHSNFKKIDTLAVAEPEWRGGLNDSIKGIKNDELSVWLKGKLKVDTVYVEQ